MSRKTTTTIDRRRGQSSWPGLVVAALVALAAVFFPADEARAWVGLYQCNPTWRAQDMPVGYALNNSGSDNLPFATIERIMSDSFSAWEQPCCSNFRANYLGTTTERAENTNQKVVVSFIEQTWPQQLGDERSTIGVTRTSVYSDCTIRAAPIVFNGVYHNFIESCAASSCPLDRREPVGGGRYIIKNYVHLQSVATHEVGHLLGLGHTNIQDATMYAVYQDGSSASTLHQDDVNGVCALYPRQCTCRGPADCADGEGCVNGQCVEVPCQHDNECDPGLRCIQGDCVVPPCQTDTECGDGFRCNQMTKSCEPKCAVCRTCTRSEECGSNGVCANVGNGPKCILPCDQQGLCPGDSVCVTVRTSNGDFDICANPDASTAGLCPTSYVCQEEQVVDPCSLCGANEVCVDKKCVANDPCANCSTTEVCVDNRCVPQQMTEEDMGGTMSSDLDLGSAPDMSSTVEPDPEPDMGMGMGGETADLGDSPNRPPDRVIIIAESGQKGGLDEEASCSAAAPTLPAPASGLGLGLLALLGAGLLGRRRQAG